MGSRLYRTKCKAKGVASDADIEALIENEEQFHCKLCDVYSNSEIMLDTHLNGKKHKAKVAKNYGIQNSELRKVEEDEKQVEEEKQQLWCEICKVECNSGVIMETHLNGKKHRAKTASERKMEMKQRQYWCEVCEVELNSEVLKEAHVNGKNYRAKEAKLVGRTREGRVEVVVNECGDGNEKGLVEEKKNGDNEGGQLTMSEVEDEEGSGEAMVEEKTNENDGGLQEKKSEGEEFWCLGCKVKCDSRTSMVKHLSGMEHKVQQALRLGKPIDGME